MEYSDILWIIGGLVYFVIALMVTGLCEKKLKKSSCKDKNDSTIAILVGAFWIFFIPLFMTLKWSRKS